MNKKAESKIILSGNPLIDNSWGGFYKGGSFILIGPTESGKTILALQFALNTSAKSERSLILSTAGMNDLTINSTIINLDIQDFIDKGLTTVVRISESQELKQSTKRNFDIKEFYDDVIKLTREYSPNKIVLDEFTPFLNPWNKKDLIKIFLELMKFFQKKEITTLYVLEDKSMQSLGDISQHLLNLSSANILLYKNEKQISKSNPGLMKIFPNHNYPRKELSSSYYVLINKGIEINFEPQNNFPSAISDN